MPEAKTTHVYGIGSPRAESTCMIKIPVPKPKNMNKITTTGSDWAVSARTGEAVMSSSAATNIAPCDIERVLKPNITDATSQKVWLMWACNGNSSKTQRQTNVPYNKKALI